MATMDSSTRSGTHCLPGTCNIAPAQFPDPAPVEAVDVDVDAEIELIVKRLNDSFSGPDPTASASLFTTNGYWRDHLMLSWSFRTVQGPAQIAQFLQSCAKSKDGFRIRKVAIDASTPLRRPTRTSLDGGGTVPALQVFITVESVLGWGEGVVRLAREDGAWKIFALYTSLRGLRGHDEGTLEHRPQGVSHGELLGRQNWADRRALAQDYKDGSEPAVLIVGAGQAGLTAAVRLKMLGVDALVIDPNDRIGDNWRKRYHQLVLHDPVWYDHMPYLPFPPQWPVFTPKDKLAGWFESYAATMELNVWTRTSVAESSWDHKEARWTVTLNRQGPDGDGSGESRTFHPRHIVQATGSSGQKSVPELEGIDNFQGRRLCHSAEFTGAADDGRGRKAVIVGSCNSGHDIAQDFFEKGYDVTMVQRSSTNVVSSRFITDVELKSLYSESGPPVDDADMLVHSMPMAMFKAVGVDVAKAQRVHDKELLEGLEKAGFKVNSGPHDAGLFFQFLQRGGGYYIDVGASRLIVEGKIRVVQGRGIERILPHGLRLSDGSEVEADEIVLATGYQNMRTLTGQIFGPAVAEAVGSDVWGITEEGEVRNMWQRTGQPGFWYHGGNLAFCRYFSRLLALQIKGQEEGLYGHGED